MTKKKTHLEEKKLQLRTEAHNLEKNKKKRAKEICIINSEELLDKLQIRYYQKRKYHTGLQSCCSCNKFKSKNSNVHTLLIGGKENRLTEDEETDYVLKDENITYLLMANFMCVSCTNEIKLNNKKRNTFIETF